MVQPTSSVSSATSSQECGVWCGKIDTDQADRRSSWKSYDRLLSRGRMCWRVICLMLKPSIGFFTVTVSKVQSSTSDAIRTTLSCMHPGVLCAAFSSVIVDDVIDTDRQLPDKSSAADPMPTSVLKQFVHSRLHHTSPNCSIARWPPATFHLGTRKRSSHRSPRKQAWIQLISVHIDQSRTCRLYRSFLSASLFVTAWPIHHPPTSVLRFEPSHSSSTETAVLQVMSELLSLDHVARTDSTQQNCFASRRSR